MTDRQLAYIALALALLGFALGLVHSFARVPPAHSGAGFP